VHYEIHAGDSFLVHGDASGAPVLVERGSDGSCQRPPAGDPAYSLSRLLEPRLRLGPRGSLADNDPQRCSSNLNDWILHRVPSSPEATSQESCQSVRNVGMVQFPLPLNGMLAVVPGDSYPLQPTPGKNMPDQWVSSEYELLSSLPLNDPGNRNLCFLTGSADEVYPTPMNSPILPSCYQSMQPVSPICFYPGDHTEYAGVRRIHFETPSANLVMRVPQTLFDPTQPFSDCSDSTKPCVCTNPQLPCPPPMGSANQQIWNPAVWAVPPEGYSIGIAIEGGLSAYTVTAQSAQQDVSSGVIAQDLKSATNAPSGAIFLVDEGQSGTTTALRGQVLRVNGSTMDSLFLLR
jgi:hypothetical protein